jgi:hypothetical protein
MHVWRPRRHACCPWCGNAADECGHLLWVRGVQHCFVVVASWPVSLKLQVLLPSSVSTAGVTYGLPRRLRCYNSAPESTKLQHSSSSQSVMSDLGTISFRHCTLWHHSCHHQSTPCLIHLQTSQVVPQTATLCSTQPLVCMMHPKQPSNTHLPLQGLAHPAPPPTPTTACSA